MIFPQSVADANEIVASSDRTLADRLRAHAFLMRKPNTPRPSFDHRCQETIFAALRDMCLATAAFLDAPDDEANPSRRKSPQFIGVCSYCKDRVYDNDQCSRAFKDDCIIHGLHNQHSSGLDDGELACCEAVGANL